MGYLSGKVTSSTRTPFIILSHYLGLSVPAFDVIYHQLPVENSLIGSNLLVSVYRNLNFLGFNLPDVEIFCHLLILKVLILMFIRQNGDILKRLGWLVC